MYFNNKRAKKIAEELKSYIYSGLISIDQCQYTEGNYLNIDEANKVTQWGSLNRNDRWGKKDGHYWFKTTVTVPENIQGKTIALLISTDPQGWDATNPQFMLYVNEELIQGIDVNHREVILNHHAQGGITYHIDLHAYSGMIEAQRRLERRWDIRNGI